MTRNVGRHAAHGPEAEFEPGSRNRVLRNLLGIRSAREMARAESRALLSAQEQLVDSFSTDHRFAADDICGIHRTWLGSIYPWAGEGNGRCARLLALMMAFQAGLPPLDFSSWSGGGVRNYIAAVHAAVGSDYEPMVGLFSEMIQRTYDRFGRRGR